MGEHEELAEWAMPDDAEENLEKKACGDAEAEIAVSPQSQTEEVGGSEGACKEDDVAFQNAMRGYLGGAGDQALPEARQKRQRLSQTQLELIAQKRQQALERQRAKKEELERYA